MADDNQALLLQVSADLSKLEKNWEKALKSVNDNSDKMERRAKKLSANFNGSFTGEGFGEALKKFFDSSRVAVLEEGSTKLRLFGSALEPLGALGITAAAGVAALGIALEEGHKAAEYADQLYKLAKNAHVSTDELQQMQFALRLAGGKAEDAAGGLEAFSAKLGQAQAGLPKAQRGFLELGFSKEQIKGFADAGTALDAVVERIAALKSPAQKDAVIEQLGLANLKPLIEAGADKMREFKAEAVAAGAVMDAHLIVRGHELNEQIETISAKIKTRMAEAFIAVGPILVKLLGYLADMATAVEHVVAAFAPLEARSDRELGRRQEELQNQVTALGLKSLSGQKLSLPEQEVLARTRSKLGDVNAERARRAAEQVTPTLPSGGAGLADISHHGGSDQTGSFEKAAQDAYLEGLKALTQAQAALTNDIAARGQAEKAVVDQELAKKLTDLDAEELKIRQAKNDAKKNEQRALLEKAKTEATNAAAAKKELIDRQTDFALEDQADETRKQLVAATLQQLEAAAAQATTAAERTAIERDILKLKQEEYRHELGKTLSRQVQTGELSQSEADRRYAGGLSTLAPARAQFDLAHEDPIEKYLRSIQDVNTAAKTAAVTFAHDLTTGLVQAAFEARNLGDVAKNVFLQLEESIAQSVLEKSVVGPIAGAISGALGKVLGGVVPKHALGTPFSAGGPSIVGEQGPEVVWLPRGARVDPDGARLRALRSLGLPGYGGGAGGGGSAGGFVQHNEINFNGPVANGREVQLSAQQVQARLARAAAAGRRGV